MIGLLLGYPHEMWPKLKEWSERTIVGGGGPRYVDDDVMTAAMEFASACSDLYTEKQACPADDIMTVWTTAEIDGEPLGLDRVINDCLLLLDGGAETTRTVIARTIIELANRPDQYALLRDGADMTVATEEFIRWVTPVLNMCRVANRDYELHGTTIRQGQQVVLMYPSANRDPAHFDEPERYDVTRTPNQHVAFGFGTHFCLGAALARLEIRLFFEEFVRRVRTVRVVPGSVDYLAERVRQRRQPRRGRARARSGLKGHPCTTSRSATARSSTARGARRVVGDVAMKDGVIVAVSDSTLDGDAAETIDATGLVVTPGLRRHPHALRRPGHVGPAARAVVEPRRHHRGRRQLRRRLRARAARATRSG